MSNKKKLLMKRNYKIMLFVIATILLCSLVSTAILRYEYFDDPRDQQRSFSDTTWISQVFQVGSVGVSEDFVIKNFSVVITYTLMGSNGTLEAILRPTSNLANYPNNGSTNYSTGSFNVSGKQTATVEWVNISMSDYTLIAGENYSISIGLKAGEDNEGVQGVGTDTTGGYAGGALYQSIDSGEAWSIIATDDVLFEIWGSTVEAGDSIEVSLTYPENSTTLSTTKTYFNTTVNPINYNLTNITFYIWYANGTLFNSTINNTLSVNSNITWINVSGLTLNNYIWNVEACGKLSNGSTPDICNMSVSNYSFSIGATIDSENYSLNIYETASETFQVNMTLFPGSTLYDAKLIYNGTNYTVSDIVNLGGNSYSLTRKIDIPLNLEYFVNDTKGFYWYFIYVDLLDAKSSQTTTAHYQNIGYTVINICNTTYETSAINFTFRDEVTNIEINGTHNKTTVSNNFNYWLGTGTVKKNYSYSNFSANKSQYKFCLLPVGQSVYTNMDMEYEAVAYSPRTYYLRNASLSNVTNEIGLPLLSTEDSIKFFFEVRQGTSPFTNAVVTISKFFIGEGIYRTIGIRETDDVGEFIEYLDLDKKYKFSIVRDGISYGTITKVANCEEAPCEIVLQLETAEVDLWQGFYNTFAQNIAYSLVFNSTSKNVTFTFNDLTGLAQYFRLEVYEISYNQTGAVICNDTLYTTAGTIICDLSAYTSGDFVANAYVSRSPERFVNYILIVIQAIADILGATGIFVAFIIIVTVGLVGAWNPAVGVALVAFSVFMMRILGFAAFGYTTIILIFIMAIILIMKMKT